MAPEKNTVRDLDPVSLKPWILISWKILYKSEEYNMNLVRFRVKEFRSVKDSGWINVDRITTLIGTNESGKTNILLPLWKLNPSNGEDINLSADLPREKYHQYRNAPQKPIFIQAVYCLNDAEREELSSISNFTPEEIGDVEVSRDFDGNYYCSLIGTNSGTVNNESRDSISDESAISYLKDTMPKYVYYSNYGNLDSEIYLPRVIADFSRNNLSENSAAKVRTIKTLFSYVNLDPTEISELGNEDTSKKPAQALSDAEIEKYSEKKKEREMLLASASAQFTREFNQWWKQGDYTFEFVADGNFFRIWVSDNKRPEKIELESRSTGLQWFFSFYLTFLVEAEQQHQNAILLLDEPGLTLHPNAQTDLFKFFEGLAEKNQLMYTTHSPFMVNSDHLDRVRVVYVDKSGKSVCSDDLRSPEKELGKNHIQSIYPVHAALGLTVSSTLLINCISVLVEGESDQLYLSAMKNLLISIGKIKPIKDIVFIPTGGVKGIKSITGIISGKKGERPFVIVDGDRAGQNKKKELLGDFYADCVNRVVDISTFTSVVGGEIEDMFPSKKFANIVSSFLPKPEGTYEYFEDYFKDGQPICNQIESFTQEQGISLELGWKVKLASNIKTEILRGNNRVIDENDSQLEKFVELFEKFVNE